MPNFTLRFFKLVPISVFAIALSFLSISHAGAQILWYNGDNDGNDYLYATNNSPDYSGIVYDDFNVTSAGGWQVSGVFGNFLLPNTVSTADWSILSGVSADNGGTVVASGTSPVTLTAIGSEDGMTLYHVVVTGLNVDLASGTYWLGLQPIVASGDYGYLVTTSGANAVGTPAGNDGNAFWTNSTLGIPNDGQYFQSTTAVASDLKDFSLGVSGTQAVPEPTSWALLLVGLGSLACWRLRIVQGKA
jgi:hypothetical protein